MMCMWTKKYEKKKYFLASLKSMKKGVGSGVGSGSGSISQRYGTDPGIRIRIRTKCHGSPTLLF